MAWEPNEVLGDYDDDGTIVDNVACLAETVIGHRITHVEQTGERSCIITLDNGLHVILKDTSDCCAYTELTSFLLHADKIDHIITGVRTEDGYTVWNIFADMGDVLRLNVDWTAGNPFYYGYGFSITVDDQRGEAFRNGRLTNDEASRYLIDTATN